MAAPGIQSYNIASSLLDIEYICGPTGPILLPSAATSISYALTPEKDLPCGGAGAPPPRDETSDRVASFAATILTESSTSHTFDPADFFREMKKTAITAQSFFQKLHKACCEIGIESMSPEDLWQELDLIYAFAERDLPRIWSELGPFLYTHKDYALLPRTFALWTDKDHVYVTIFLNRHKIQDGRSKGDSRIFTDFGSGKKRFSFGLSWSLFKGDSVEKALLVSSKRSKFHFPNEHDIYRTLLPTPHLAAIYTAINKTVHGEADLLKRVYVMPYYEAGDAINILYKMSHKETDVAPHVATISSLFKQIAGCLACLHARNIVHRDIKPENIFQKGTREFVLGDFEFTAEINPTLPSQKVGSKTYFSPDLVKAYECNSYSIDYKAADVWAFGLTMACLYIGEYPFVSPEGKIIAIRDMLRSVDACIRAFLDKNIYGAGLREEIKALIRQMLDVEDRRRPTMRQVCERINVLVPDEVH